MKTLLVEDDRGFAETLRAVLTKQRYLVDVSSDGQSGLELAQTCDYDLILLDWMLPKLDGPNFCKRLRAKGNRTPLLLMTAHDTYTNRVIGLDAGADDYLVKPFDVDELLARIRALLRRGKAFKSVVLEWGPLHLAPSSCRVTWRGEELRLTAKEYEILALFLRNQDRIFSQSALIDRLWSGEETPTENAVRVLIRSLRQKLKQVGAGEILETIYGLGYRLKKPPKDRQMQPSSSNQLVIESQASRKASPASETSPQIVSAGAHPVQSHSVDLSAVWQRHRGSYLNQVTCLEEAVTALQTDVADQGWRRKAWQVAHTLKGSLGSFGLKGISQDCERIAQVFQADRQLEQTQLDTLAQRIRALRQTLEKAGATTQLTPSEAAPIPASALSRQTSRLLVVDEDAGLTNQLKGYASAWGLEVEAANNPAEARQLMETDCPDVVLMDVVFSNLTEDGFSLLAEIAAIHPPVPVLVFTALESLADRVKAVRFGGTGFLHKPLPTTRVLEAITQMRQKDQASEAHLLIVDDDPQLLDILRTLLEPWGFNITFLSDPRQFWHVLEQTSPDLLILDVEMPDFSGVDLCRVVRQDPRWRELPILVLSAHTDVETRQSVFSAGADEYISKPIVAPELITRVVNRLERQQVMQKLAETDGLTGLLNQRRATQELSRLLLLANRQKKPLCFAILDLDHFKQINDRHGHEAGDVVLKCLGERLKQTFRKEDVLARWGGEEFIVALYDITVEQGLDRLKSVLDHWRQQQFVDAHNQKFWTSFSAGVVGFPQDGDDWRSLFRAADVTLYHAKAAGRNQVLSSHAAVSAD
ncbi:MAG: response regulator [Leptolyngbyaceae cyanobacterium MO_188.B28]|nr:response regulator [Leptolyngbyaceae cyanobacterium MO_188.B28]